MSAFHTRIAEPLPDHVDTMWKRLKSTYPVPAHTRKRSSTSTDIHSHDVRSQPPSKKRQSTTVPLTRRPQDIQQQNLLNRFLQNITVCVVPHQ